LNNSQAQTRSFFNKRVFNITTFRAAMDDLVDHLGDLRAAMRGKRVSKAFSERIMLAVTQVNGCRYCDYGHTRLALQAGITREEIDALAAGSFDQSPGEETIALLFAQHYAESKGQPDPESWERLVETYGEDTARDILVYIRMITVGNLYGNTLDAFFSRFRGRPAANSSLWQELGVLFGIFVIVPVALIRRLFHR
jgi:AhpD family alkylhydroperoxidase